MILLDWTRMGKTYCLAGAVVQDGRYRVVRPLLARYHDAPCGTLAGRLTNSMDMARWEVFELIAPKPAAQLRRLHLEDVWVTSLRPLRRFATPEQRRAILAATAPRADEPLFGVPLSTTRSAGFLQPGTGTRSLATLVVPSGQITFGGCCRAGTGEADLRVKLPVPELGERVLPVKDHLLLFEGRADGGRPGPAACAGCASRLRPWATRGRQFGSACRARSRARPDASRRIAGSWPTASFPCPIPWTDPEDLPHGGTDAAYLLDRVRQVRHDLGADDNGPDDPQAQRFADLLNSDGPGRGLPADRGKGSRPTTPEALEACVGHTFGTVAELAAAMQTAGLTRPAASPPEAVRILAAATVGVMRFALLAGRHGGPACRMPLQPAGQLNALLQRPPGWLERHAGIEGRRTWNRQDPLAAATEAGQECLQRSGVRVEEVGTLLVTAEAPPMLTGLAAALHHRLGLRLGTTALEVGGACTGFLAALWLARTLVPAMGTVLIVSVECCPRATCPSSLVLRARRRPCSAMRPRPAWCAVRRRVQRRSS